MGLDEINKRKRNVNANEDKPQNNAKQRKTLQTTAKQCKTMQSNAKHAKHAL